MATKRSENTLGCLAIACERASPASTSWRTAVIACLSLGASVCSSSTYSARSSERPLEIMVASWRAMTVTWRDLRPR